MPDAALAATEVDATLPVAEIGQFLVELCLAGASATCSGS